MTDARKTYFGKVCAKHPELKGERSLNNCGCVGCRRERSRISNLTPKALAKKRKYYRDYFRKHKARIYEMARTRPTALAYKKAYNESNRDLVNAKARARYALQKEKHNASCRRWREANKERKRVLWREWKAANREYYLSYCREYYLKNKAVHLAQQRSRQGVINEQQRQRRRLKKEQQQCAI